MTRERAPAATGHLKHLACPAALGAAAVLPASADAAPQTFKFTTIQIKFQLSRSKVNRGSVTGGTRRYARATGSFTSTDTSNTRSTVVVRLK